jgi:hypothetical protein
MGLSSFNAMRARERARLKAQAEAEVENKTVENETFKEEKEIKFEPIEVTEPTVEKKKTDAEKLKKKGM